MATIRHRVRIATPQADSCKYGCRGCHTAVRGSRDPMNSVLRTLKASLNALRRNVMRSVLTCLGIIIGVAAVIAMMEIGGGSSRAIEQAVASLGASVIQIDPADVSVAGVSTGGGGKATLTMEDADALRRECSVLQSVAPSVDCGGQVVYGNR